MKDGLALKSQRLEGVSYGVSQVQGLAQSLFRWVLFDDTLFHSHASGQ